MSSFSGHISLLPLVCIDRFTPDTHSAQLYLLSHIHSDHTVGLDTDAFQAMLSQAALTGHPKHLSILQASIHSDLGSETLQRPPTVLHAKHVYMHPITRHLLLCDDRYAPLRPHLRTIEVADAADDALTLEVDWQGRPAWLTVSALRAGHCPGSVMFLLECEERENPSRSCRVLYTGDCRLMADDVEQFRRFLRQRLGRRPIARLLFDSTFCQPNCGQFPTRQQSLRAFVAIIDRYRAANTDAKVFILCSARYGHEWLLEQLANHYSTRVHVTHGKLQALSCVARLRSVLSADVADGDWLHACAYWDGGLDQLDVGGSRSRAARSLPCQAVRHNALTLKPCVMWFTRTAGAEDQLAEWSSPTSCRVHFSCHASLDEMCRLIEAADPEDIEPCVIPLGSSIANVRSLMSQKLPNGKWCRNTKIGCKITERTAGSKSVRAVPYVTARQRITAFQRIAQSSRQLMADASSTEPLGSSSSARPTEDQGFDDEENTAQSESIATENGAATGETSSVTLLEWHASSAGTEEDETGSRMETKFVQPITDAYVKLFGTKLVKIERRLQ